MDKISERIKGSIKVLFGLSKAIPLQPKERVKHFFCPVCESEVDRFLPLSEQYYKKQDEVGYIHPIFQMETINRLQYSCPNCNASDRERLYALYFKREFRFPERPVRLLDIAPAKPLQELIKNKYTNITYRSADLTMANVDDKVDITKMDLYEDNLFDFFICSHVLEHVEEDKKAIGELFRILKAGGKGIVMVPILLTLETDYENPSVVTPDDRWKHFGQGDHVRMYSKSGLIDKLEQAGFKVHHYDMEFFGTGACAENGIHPRSVLYIVEK